MIMTETKQIGEHWQWKAATLLPIAQVLKRFTVKLVVATQGNTRVNGGQTIPAKRSLY